MHVAYPLRASLLFQPSPPQLPPPCTEHLHLSCLCLLRCTHGMIQMNLFLAVMPCPHPLPAPALAESPLRKGLEEHVPALSLLALLPWVCPALPLGPSPDKDSLKGAGIALPNNPFLDANSGNQGDVDLQTTF